MSEKIAIFENMENDQFQIVKEKDDIIDQKMCDYLELKQRLEADLQQKEEELMTVNNEMLELQDEKLDFQSKLEKNDGKEHVLQMEIIKLQDVVNGKDTAITQLSLVVKQTEKENDRLTDMVNSFKQKLIVENCFHTNFAAQKVGGQQMHPIKNN